MSEDYVGRKSPFSNWRPPFSNWILIDEPFFFRIFNVVAFSRPVDVSQTFKLLHELGQGGFLCVVGRISGQGMGPI
jgi:hypothetical protein